MFQINSFPLTSLKITWSHLWFWLKYQWLLCKIPTLRKINHHWFFYLRFEPERANQFWTQSESFTEMGRTSQWAKCLRRPHRLFRDLHRDLPRKLFGTWNALTDRHVWLVVSGFNGAVSGSGRFATPNPTDNNKLELENNITTPYMHSTHHRCVKMEENSMHSGAVRAMCRARCCAGVSLNNIMRRRLTEHCGNIMPLWLENEQKMHVHMGLLSFDDFILYSVLSLTIWLTHYSFKA